MIIDRQLRRPFVLTCVLVTLIVIAVHLTAERSILNQVRKLLAGVATTAAEGMMALPNFARDFQFIDGTLDPLNTQDPRHESFYMIASHLESIREAFNQSQTPQAMIPHIAFISTLRRIHPADSSHPAVRDAEGNILDDRDTWQYVVDAEWYTRDKNGDGRITPGEEGVPPGLIYREGLESDRLELALQGPTAESRFHTDAWGTWLSGYAPLRDASGEAIGVIRVDLGKGDLMRTLLKIRLVSFAAWLAFILMIALVFHAISGKTRAFNELQRKDAELESAIDELRATNTSLGEANKEFARQLELAQRIQMNFLPSEFPRTDEIAFDSIYLACEAVGGDIYDVFPIDNTHIALYIADVSGHGISAALIGATLKMSVEAMKTAVSQSGHSRASILSEPRRMITRLHSILAENLSREHFITMQYAVISTETNTMKFCNAGHTWPVWWHSRDGRAEMIETDSGLPIGYLVEDILVEQEIALTPGDKIVLYTDGLTERMDHRAEEMFGEERLAEVVSAHGDETAQSLVEHIRLAVDQFSNGSPSMDDVALVVAELLPVVEMHKPQEEVG